MRVLAIEPFYGGSHRAFLDGWIRCSRHEWTVIGYSPHHWKWRMRHAPFSAAEEVAQRQREGQAWDLLFCSDMLSLAEFRGLSRWSAPSVVYFHENQLTYPVREERERDFHFAVANFTSALAADAVWFNSGYHRDDFLNAMEPFWRRMPDQRPNAATAAIRQRAEVQPPGVDDRLFEPRTEQAAGETPTLTWAARWEFDKNPQSLFAALNDDAVQQTQWRLNVLGKRYPNAPECFAAAREPLSDRIANWGECERERYIDLLRSTDLFIATAIHEFFGIAAVEAIAAGALPLLPNRLAYPELLGVNERQGDAAADITAANDDEANLTDCYYEQDATLAKRLGEMLRLPPPRRRRLAAAAREQVERFRWSRRAAEMDERLDTIWSAAK